VGRHVLIASEPLEIALYAANIKVQCSHVLQPWQARHSVF
jgi:hypothetical protein